MKLRAQLDAAATLLDEGAASSAVRMLRSSWEPDLPTDDLVPLYCMWIRALCDTQDLEHAYTLAVRAADEFPHEADVQIALGNVLDLRGDLPGARLAFERAITIEPTGALAHYNRGAVLERLGDEDGAEQSYRTALSVDDETAPLFEASAALGALLRRSGRLEEASEVYDGYLDDDPIHVDTLVEHGICLSDLDDFAQAVERFELALSLERNHAGAWYNLAITQYRMGKPREAMHSMHRALECDMQSPLTHAVLGSWTLSLPGEDGTVDVERALELLYGALELLGNYDCEALSPSYASLVYEEVFEALWQHGRRDEAREVARMAGQRDWITAHMLETMNEADHGRGQQVTAFAVTARAEAGEAPAHWPDNAQGYTTGLMVLASDEDEARRYSLEYLRTIEPYPSVQFKIETIHAGGHDEVHPSAETQPRARGVVKVRNARAYFRQ